MISEVLLTFKLVILPISLIAPPSHLAVILFNYIQPFFIGIEGFHGVISHLFSSI
jgi:hypothetical protein